MSSRLVFARKCALYHFTMSVFIALLCALVVFKGWYPYPFYRFMGGISLYLLVLGVDVVCGPLLTLILANPVKPMRERFVDFSLIALIQISALAYGCWTLYEARPVALVFEVDRFVAVRATAIMDEDSTDVAPTFQRLPLFGQKIVAARQPRNAVEEDKNLTLSLAGYEPSQRPSQWVEIDASQVARIHRAAKGIKQLMQWYPQESDDIAALIDSHNLNLDEVWFLPMTSGIVTEPGNEVIWSVVLDKDMTIIGFLPVDGFGP